MGKPTKKQNRILMDLISSFEPQYRLVNLGFTLSMVLAGVFLLINHSSFFNAMMSFIVAGIGIFLHFFRKKTTIQFKITITMIFLSVYTINLLFDYGLFSGGILGLTLIVVLASVFLSRYAGFIVILFAGGFLSGFAIFVYQSDFLIINAGQELYLNKSVWVYQSITFWLFILVTYLSMHSIKFRLADNIEELKKSEERLKNMAYYDEITGLFNRNYFEKELINQLRELEGQPFLMALMDIKNFRLINNMFGNEQGDRFLLNIADELRTVQNDRIIFSRIGSNEFIMIAFDWDVLQFRDFINHCMIQVINSTQKLAGLPRQQFLITYLEDIFFEGNFNHAIKNLSIAMKFGKENDYNGIFAYRSQMSKQYEEETQLLADVEKALLEDEFEVFYQGKWSTEQSRFVGFEALARWKKGEEYISPMVFIPIIMKSSFWIQFSEILFIKAIREFEELIHRSSSPKRNSVSLL
ncbi:MAG: diguanylate cyclase [Vallitaleaceae bacterium]|nr:diguanylate cyclase [Vallitaleaceae bacterium]